MQRSRPLLGVKQAQGGCFVRTYSIFSTCRCCHGCGRVRGCSTGVKCHVALRIEQLGFLGCICKLYGCMLTLLFVLVVTREPWPALSTIAKSSPLSWIGGVFGTVYIVASIMLLPRLGAMTVIALLITGQMLASVAFDHFGLFGLAQRPIDLYRAGGAVLLVLGALLVRS